MDDHTGQARLAQTARARLPALVQSYIAEIIFPVPPVLLSKKSKISHSQKHNNFVPRALPQAVPGTNQQ